MATFIDEARTTADSITAHITDHNDIHQWINAKRNLEAALHADSDYFDDESIASYTELDITGNTVWAEKYGILSCRHDTIASDDIGLLGKTMTASGPPVTLECMVTNLTVNPGASSAGGGIFFSDGLEAASNVLDLTYFLDNGGLTVSMRSGTATAHSTAEAAITFVGTNWDGPGFYPLHLRLTWDSANTWSAYYSIDRVSWNVVGEAASFTMTPDSLGFDVIDSGSTALSISSWQNFEVTEADPGQAA